MANYKNLPAANWIESKEAKRILRRMERNGSVFRQEKVQIFLYQDGYRWTAQNDAADRIVKALERLRTMAIENEAGFAFIDNIDNYGYLRIQETAPDIDDALHDRLVWRPTALAA